MTDAADTRWEAQQRGGTWKNTDSTECPAYGVFEVTGCVAGPHGRPIINGRQWTGQSEVVFGLNGPYKVGPGSHGRCTFDYPAFVATTVTTPVGGIVGPFLGTWEMNADGSGFRSLGATEPDTALVVVSSSSGGSRLIVGRTKATISPGGSGLIDEINWNNPPAILGEKSVRFFSGISDEPISQGKMVFAYNVGPYYVIISAECENSQNGLRLLMSLSGDSPVDDGDCGCGG